MQRAATIAALLLLGGLLPMRAIADSTPAPALQAFSLPELEQRLADIDAELEQLASYTLHGGMGALGYRSRMHEQPDEKEWIRIELGPEVPVDQVILAPTLYRDARIGLQGEGFPIAFRLLAGTDQTTNIVATFSEEDNLLPRIAPLAISFQPVNASWIGLETTVLSPRIMDGKYMLQLSEIMVFSGLDNVALEGHVAVPNPSKKRHSQDHARFLTDGFTPFLMDAAQGTRSQTELIYVRKPEPPPTLTIDLQTTQTVNQVNLHTAQVSLSIPATQFEHRAVPRHVRVMGANHPDFSDQTVLCEYSQNTVYDSGPIIMRRFPETRCRYVRLVIVNHRPVISLVKNPSSIAFSEVEVLSSNRNVARGAPVTVSANLHRSEDILRKLTDGLNYYGEILPTRTWMNELARRHDLATLRPRVVAELGVRYARQKANLHRLAWLAALLIVGATIAVLAERFAYHRKLTRLKLRFAADLHDELGANLHTIGLLSDLAEESRDDPDEWSAHLRRIRSVTERTSQAVRNAINLHESKDLFAGLTTDMQRAAERIVAQLEHGLSVEGEEYLARIEPQRQMGIFLFYKECLINICRHAGATRLSTHLSASPRNIRLVVTDNGRGIPESLHDGIPRSLKRRARLLKARLTVETPESGGTSITLTLRTRGWRGLGR